MLNVLFVLVTNLLANAVKVKTSSSSATSKVRAEAAFLKRSVKINRTGRLPLHGFVQQGDNSN
jgi:hypothetical protein